MIPESIKLPLQCSLREALSIYAERLGIFLLIALFNVFIFVVAIGIINLAIGAWQFVLIGLLTCSVCVVVWVVWNNRDAMEERNNIGDKGTPIKERASNLSRISAEELLHREPIYIDTDSISVLLAKKRVLVTGGGSPIGSELCRQILNYSVATLIILDHSDDSVFAIIQKLSHYVQGLPKNERPHLEAVIADIRFRDRLKHVFAVEKPDIVFHVANHNHVSLMERNPTEAISKNVLGTRNVLSASLSAGVGRFVMLSSTKAINPTSIMGASKRCAELIVRHAAERSGLPYVVVRIGNLLDDQGSLVSIFKEQIARGGPVTVTHPHMARYYMSIHEAVQLALQAAVLGSGGETFILDMGEPVNISQLAQDLIELCGYEVGRDIDLVYSELRPGEKLFEELFIEGKTYARTAHTKIFQDIDPAASLPADLDELVDTLVAMATSNDIEAMIRTLQTVIPEYSPMNTLESRRQQPPVPLVKSDLEKARSQKADSGKLSENWF